MAGQQLSREFSITSGSEDIPIKIQVRFINIKNIT